MRYLIIVLFLLAACGREEAFISVPTLTVNPDGSTHCEPIGDPVCDHY